MSKYLTVGATGRESFTLRVSAQDEGSLPGAFGYLIFFDSVAFAVQLPGPAWRKLQSHLLDATALPRKLSTEFIIAQEVGQIFLVTSGRVQEPSTSNPDHPSSSRSF